MGPETTDLISSSRGVEPINITVNKGDTEDTNYSNKNGNDRRWAQGDWYYREVDKSALEPSPLTVEQEGTYTGSTMEITSSVCTRTGEAQEDEREYAN